MPCFLVFKLETMWPPLKADMRAPGGRTLNVAGFVHLDHRIDANCCQNKSHICKLKGPHRSCGSVIIYCPPHLSLGPPHALDQHGELARQFPAFVRSSHSFTATCQPPLALTATHQPPSALTATHQPPSAFKVSSNAAQRRQQPLVLQCDELLLLASPHLSLSQPG